MLEEVREARVAARGLREGGVVIMRSGGQQAPPDHVGPCGRGQDVE